MPSVNLNVLARTLLRVKEGIEEVWKETKNHEHEERLRKEMERLEALLRQLEEVILD